MGHALNGLFWEFRSKNIILVGMGHALNWLIINWHKYVYLRHVPISVIRVLGYWVLGTGLVRPTGFPQGLFFSSKKQYCMFTKLYVHLRGVLECVFKCPGKKMSNMASPANLTMLSRTASKFCAHICAAPPEIFFLDLKSYENSGIIGPWPECQLTPTTTSHRDSNTPVWATPGKNIPFGPTPHSDITCYSLQF